jgi:hypothetical protein
MSTFAVYGKEKPYMISTPRPMNPNTTVQYQQGRRPEKSLISSPKLYCVKTNQQKNKNKLCVIS